MEIEMNALVFCVAIIAGLLGAELLVFVSWRGLKSLGEGDEMDFFYLMHFIFMLLFVASIISPVQNSRRETITIGLGILYVFFCSLMIGLSSARFGVLARVWSLLRHQNLPNG